MSVATNNTVANDLRAWLVQQPAIRTLVEDRVSVSVADEDEEKPYIVFRRSSNNSEKDLAGQTGYEVTTFDLECRADSEALATAVSDTVRSLVDGFPRRDSNGSLTNGDTWNAREIGYCSCNDQSNDYEIIPTGSWETDSIIALIIEVHSYG